MQRTEKYFENDAFRKTAAGVILAAEADAKTGGGRIALTQTARRLKAPPGLSLLRKRGLLQTHFHQKGRNRQIQ